MAVFQRLHARCACGAVNGGFSLSGTKRNYERSRPFSIGHLALDLVLDLDEKSVSGTATLSFERVSGTATEIELDAVGFDIERVELEERRRFRAARFTYDGDRLTVTVGKRLESGRVRIRYRAHPKRGLYFLGPDDVVVDRPRQVWSQCQDEDARHWFPCHDKPHAKMTVELSIAVPPGFVALSNGDPLPAARPRGKKRPWQYRFRMRDPMPSYLVTLVVGQFDVVNDREAKCEKGKKVPIAYYVPVGRKADALRSLGETPRMVELFGKLTGVPFPWQRYSQVVVSDFIFGGMENTTATTLYEHVLLDERAAIDVTSNDLIAHELAHHWFGDYVTCRDWSHAWLNEGFATFFEHVDREHRLDRDEYDYGVAGDVEAYLAEANGRYTRPIVCRQYEHPIDLFDRHLYEKGGLVLHMLRRELGDEVFWAGVHRYLEAHAHAIVETNDLMRAFEAESGASLERFFDQWVYSPGHPTLKVKIGYERGTLSVGVQQTQKANDFPVFAFPLEIEIGWANGRLERRKKLVTERNDALVVTLKDRPAWVAFDPDFRVVGDVSIEAPADLLIAQLRRASSGRARWMAARTLSKRLDQKTIEALGEALADRKERWMVRAEAAVALGRIGSDGCYARLEPHLSSSHPKVRRAVASALGEFRTAEAARTLARVAKKDPSYLVEAEAARALGKTRRPEALRTLRQVVDHPSWADVKRAAALDAMGALRDDGALVDLLQRTRYGVPTRGRQAAIAAVAALSDDKKAREHLELLLDDADPYLRMTVVRALETMGHRRSRRALRRRLDRELDGRVARRIREALRSMTTLDATERKQLGDDVESLRRELRDLKLRLERFEQTHPKKRSARRK